MVIPTKSEESFETLRGWLATPLGEALLQQEFRLVEEALDGIFGEQCLQLGLWGVASHPRSVSKDSSDWVGITISW